MRAVRSVARGLLATLLSVGALSGCDAPPAPQSFPTTEVAAIDTPPPEYPLEVACEGIGGTVELLLTIGTEGTVTRVDTRESSGQAALDEAAREAVRSWRFRPATRNGQPVEVQIAVPMTFNVPPSEPEGCYYLSEGGTAPATS